MFDPVTAFVRHRCVGVASHAQALRKQILYSLLLGAILWGQIVNTAIITHCNDSNVALPCTCFNDSIRIFNLYLSVFEHTAG